LFSAAPMTALRRQGFEMIWQAADSALRLAPCRAAGSRLTGLNGVYMQDLLPLVGGRQRG
jgi:hypothetical protein